MVRRFRNPVRLSVGKQRVPRTDSETHAAFTYSVRKQMQGVMKNLEAWVNHLGAESADVLYEALLPTFQKSQVYVPRKSGDLAASGYIEKRAFRGRNIVEMGYGRGGDPHYAPIVHEIEEYEHVAPARAKFLQSAIEEDADQIQRLIYEKMQEAAGV